MRTALVAVPLLVLAGLAARASDAVRTTPRAPAGVASLLGGFTALAVQVLWMRADQALVEFREDDAQLAFAAIGELEPQLVSGGDYVARAIGFTLADGHRDPAVRWALGREGLRVLDRTVERNPGDARALAARAHYEFLRLAVDPAMRAGFVRDLDRDGPFVHAIRDYEAAIRLRPGWLEPWYGLALSSMGRARELLAEGLWDDAAPPLRRAAVAFDRLVAAWTAMGDRTLDENVATSTQSALLARTLADLCALPDERRRAQYEDLRAHVPELRLPALPPR